MVAQDLFEKENNEFLAQHGLTMHVAAPNGTNSTAQLAVASTESWWKTITPTESQGLCIDLPGGNPYIGNMFGSGNVIARIVRFGFSTIGKYDTLRMNLFA